MSFDKTSTRREFIHKMSINGLGSIGIMTFLQSCEEKGIAPSSNLIEAYIEGILSIIEKIRERELSKINQAAGLAIQTRLQGYRLFTHLVGGMLPLETSPSRPGSPHVFFTDPLNNSARGDIVITNDPESVRGLGERFIKIVGITTPSTPNSNTPLGTHENMSALRIEDVSDIVIFCHVPYMDGILNIEGVDIHICPVSGIIHTLIYYALVAEIVEGLTKSGIYPEVG
ncbi:hypothetical protein ACFL1R_10360 [Candidatus Latescibacterota bacterium]